MSADLVFLSDDGDPFTTSLVIAAETGNEHASVMRLVRENLADLNEGGMVRFEIRPRPEGQHGGGDVQYAQLDEPAAALLMTYFRNNPVVKEFKKRLVAGFYMMRRALAEQQEAAPKFLIPKTYAGALRCAAEQAERAELAEQENKALTARIEKDAPLVAKAEAHSKADNAAVNRQVFAREVQAWGLKQGINILHEHVYELLRRKGMLISGQRSDRNHATAQAQKAGWAWTHKDVTPDGHATAVTYLRASGQDLAWKWVTEHVAAYGDLRPRTTA